MRIKKAYRPSPRCPHCDQTTRPAASLFGTLFELETFECDLCGLVITRPATAQMTTESVPA
jgi:hypothetical protein